MKLPRSRLWLGLVLVLTAAVGWWSWARSRTIRLYTYEVVARYPHDPDAYTQGLLFADGSLYESTGRYGSSSVRVVALESGAVQREVKLGTASFGEGLALVGERLIQLTWKEEKALVYDKNSLVQVGQFPYRGEGWGLAFDGETLVQSDGTDLLRFRDPTTFAEIRRVRVRAGDEPVRLLNELEYIDGEIWANVWKAPYIARIDPDSGRVKGWVVLKGIFDASGIPDEDAVLNGIAYDGSADRIFVTGKLWPTVFEIRVHG